MMDESFNRAREVMIQRQLIRRGITDARVLAAMREVPRHLFVPDGSADQAYDDHPLPIGEGQTISQPYIVSLMTVLLDIPAGGRVLELGTGSGYQTALLARLAAEVYTVERIPSLARRAQQIMELLEINNVRFRTGDGTMGWPEAAPFDGIMVTAAAPSVPQPLLEQLAVGGRLVIPVGSHYLQTLTVITRDASGNCTSHDEGGCVFVKLIGRYGWDSES